MRRFFTFLGLLWLALAGAAQAAPEFPDRGIAPVVDAANIIDPATEAALTEKLLAFEQRNQRQFVVATVPDLQGYDIADYGYQLGRHWGLGDKENNDGVILMVAPKEHKVRIEVGYGLESILPDGLAFNIINTMTPRFKAEDYGGGITLGADAIIKQLELPPEEAQAIAAQASAPQHDKGGFPFGILVWIGFLFFFFILPMIARGHGGRRYRGGGGVGSAVGNVIMWSALNAALNSGRGGGGGGSSWGGGGGGYGGGGGFSGGGGSFGGGGASGGW
jgi:uncharacterized protein